MMKLRKQYPVVKSAVILFKNLPEWRSHRWMLPPALAPERCLAFDFDTGPMLFQGLSYSRVTEDDNTAFERVLRFSIGFLDQFRSLKPR